MEFSTWLQDVHANGDYELSLVDHAESHDFYKWTTPDYYFHYDGKQAQELYVKALAATDEESSANYLKQAAKAVSEDAPRRLAVRISRDGGIPQERAGIPQQAEPDGAAIVADHQGAVNRRKIDGKQVMKTDVWRCLRRQCCCIATHWRDIVG